MMPYTESIFGTGEKFEMIPIPSGKFFMGSPENEDDRSESEGPVNEVKISPFGWRKLKLLGIATLSLCMQKRKKWL